MKLKKLAVATALAISIVPVMAQDFEGTSIEDRISATNNGNEDSIKIGRQNVSLFQQSMDIKDYKEARNNLLWLKKNAPFAINGIYTQGPLMYYFLISDPNETDKAKKLQKELEFLRKEEQKTTSRRHFGIDAQDVDNN